MTRLDERTILGEIVALIVATHDLIFAYRARDALLDIKLGANSCCFRFCTWSRCVIACHNEMTSF